MNRPSTNHPARHRLAPLLLAPLLLTACTGTTEPQLSARLGLVNLGGAELRTVTPGGVASDTVQAASRAADLEVLPGGSQVMVAFRDHIELRDASLGSASTLAAPAGLTPCYVRLRASPARDRIAALSDCGSGAAEQLVVYRSDATLAFIATLPPPTPSSSDLSRFTVTTNQAVWLARPATGGGSELIRADENGVQVVTNPPLSATVYDLAMRGGAMYAATDNGVRQVNFTEGTTTTSATAALSQATVMSTLANRLYGSDRLLGAWLSGAGSQGLTVWDGTRTGVAAYPSDLRDLTFAPDGNAYALTGTALTRLDTVLGLNQGNWQPTDVASNLNDARAVTWLTAP
ncbi:hypothetical protein [Deinococcus sp.]|uniref:hypothetical protein n=1 Tax=Deinococcus sp. TaxID=47478 RepID=UPI003C7AF8DF